MNIIHIRSTKRTNKIDISHLQREHSHHRWLCWWLKTTPTSVKDTYPRSQQITKN